MSAGIRSGGSRAGTLMIPGRGAVDVNSNASLFDVVHGTSKSRALGSGVGARFS